jgi:hypothetical protein
VAAALRAVNEFTEACCQPSNNRRKWKGCARVTKVVEY